MRATQALTWIRAWKIVVPAAGLGMPAVCKAVPMTRATTDNWFQLMKIDFQLSLKKTKKLRSLPPCW